MDAEDAELLLGVNILLLSLLKRRIAVQRRNDASGCGKSLERERERERERETYGAFHTYFNELRLFDREYFCR